MLLLSVHISQKFQVCTVQSSQRFAEKMVQYADYVTREYVVITNGRHRIPMKPSPRRIRNERLLILPVSVRCPLPFLVRGGNNSVSRSCMKGCFPSPLPSLPQRLMKFIGLFIDFFFFSFFFFLSSDLCIPQDENDHPRHAYEHAFINALRK